MLTKSPSSAVKTFGVFVFILLAGGIITVLTLQTSNSDSQDIRSRAANPETIIKEWNFTGGTTAGWTGSTGVSVSVPARIEQVYPLPPQYLIAQYTSKGSEITNNDAAPRIILAETLQAPVGIKKFRIWLRVSVPSIQRQGSDTKQKNDSNSISKSRAQPRPNTVPFKFSIQYLKKTGNTWKWSNAGTFSGTTEQGFKEFVIPWEDSLPLQADRFRLMFNRVGAAAAATVQIQKIIIAVEKVPATPTPTLTPTPATVSYTGIVRAENPPTPTPSSGRVNMMARAPDYVLVVGGTTYVLTFDTKTTVTPTTTFMGDAVRRGGGGGNSAGMQLYVGMSAFVGCQVAVTGVTAPTIGSRPAILVSSVQKTGACGL